MIFLLSTIPHQTYTSFQTCVTKFGQSTSTILSSLQSLKKTISSDYTILFCSILCTMTDEKKIQTHTVKLMCLLRKTVFQLSLPFFILITILTLIESNSNSFCGKGFFGCIHKNRLIRNHKIRVLRSHLLFENAISKKNQTNFDLGKVCCEKRHSTTSATQKWSDASNIYYI